MQSCVYDHDVATAARTGQWTDALRSHVQTCALCGETVSLVTSLHRIAGETIAQVSVPVSYRILWLRAQFTRRQEHLSRLDRFMLMGLFAAVTCILVGIALWKWGLVQRWIASVSADPGSNLPLYVLAGCAALLWFLTEEVFLTDK